MRDCLAGYEPRFCTSLADQAGLGCVSESRLQVLLTQLNE